MEKVVIQPRSFLHQVTSFCSVFDPDNHPANDQKHDQKQIEEVKQPEQVKEVVATADADVRDVAADEIEPIAKALPEFVAAPGDVVDYRFQPPAFSADGKPPQPHFVRENPFQPKKRVALDAKVDREAASVLKQPLIVERHMPDGEVAAAHRVLIKFSQPIAPLTSLEKMQDCICVLGAVDEKVEAPKPPADAVLVPGRVFVHISPPVPNAEWKFLDNKTLILDSNKRFPGANKYTVFIHPATTSLYGNSIGGKGHTILFSTSPNHLVSSSPYHEQITDLSPLFCLQFAQEIDREKVAKLVKLGSPSGEVGLELVDSKELKESTGIDTSRPHIILRPVKTLVKNTTYKWGFTAPIPSSEGPLVGHTPSQFKFSTYPPLQFVVQDKARYPYLPYVSSNNPLETSSIEKDMVKISPHPEFFDIHVTSSYIYAEQKFDMPLHPFKKYKVTIDGAVRDVYGQMLGSKKEFTLQSEPPEQMLEIVNNTRGYGGVDSGSNNSCVVVDPFRDDASLLIESVNMSSVLVFISKPAPDGFMGYLTYESKLSRWNTDINLNPLKIALDSIPLPPGELLVESLEIPLNKAESTDRTTTRIDLSKYMKEHNCRDLIVVLHPKYWNVKSWFNLVKRPFLRSVWVSRTTLALTTSMCSVERDKYSAVFQCSNLKTGEGVPNALVRYGPEQNECGKTDKDGLLFVDAFNLQDEGSMVFAKTDNSHAFDVLYPGYSYFLSSFARVFSDRGLYRPGETATFTGFIRRVSAANQDEPQLPVETECKLFLQNSEATEVWEGTAPIDKENGAFKATVSLPKQLALLGEYFLFVSVGTLTATCKFKIEEFRRPEFEARCEAVSESNRVLFFNDHVLMKASASYYSSGPLKHSPVNCKLSWRLASFVPAGQDNYTFACNMFQPFSRGPSSWEEEQSKIESEKQHKLVECLQSWNFPPFVATKKQKQWSTTLNKNGEYTFGLDFKEINEDAFRVPVSVSVEATVINSNNQEKTAASSLFVHPSEYYVGLRPMYPIYLKQLVVFDVVVCDSNGRLLKGVPVKLTQWTLNQGKWVTQEFHAKSSDNPNDPCLFITPPVKYASAIGAKSTFYTAECVDSKNRVARTYYTPSANASHLEEETHLSPFDRVSLRCDRESCAPGDQVVVTVQSPVTPATARLFTLRSGKLRQLEVVELKEAEFSKKIAIDDKDVPRLVVYALVEGAKTKKKDPEHKDQDGETPTCFIGCTSLELSVSFASRRLRITAKPEKDRLQPKETTRVAISVRNSDNKALQNGLVSVVVVDKSILDMVGHKWPDLTEFFYKPSAYRILPTSNYQRIVFGDRKRSAQFASDFFPQEIGMIRDDPMDQPAGPRICSIQKVLEECEDAKIMQMESRSMDALMPQVALQAMSESKAPAGPAPEASKPIAINVRSDFNPLACHAFNVPTDEKGDTTIEMKLADNLTTYKVFAIATSGPTRFGLGETEFSTSLPVMLRASPPRFLNFGDRCVLQVVVTNQNDKAVKTRVLCRLSNLAFRDNETPMKEVVIREQDSVLVTFRIRAKAPGTARFQVVAFGGANFTESYDAAVHEFPVYTPASSEAFATYEVLDSPEPEQKKADLNVLCVPIEAPENAISEFGGLELSFASTNLQNMTDALVYLYEYPYDCTEQVCSRLMSIVLLRDFLSAFNRDSLPKPADLKDFVDNSLRQAARACQSEGLAFWANGVIFPYLTVHMAHCLARVAEKGYEIPPKFLNKVRALLENVHNTIPFWYSKECKLSIRGYALYVRNLTLFNSSTYKEAVAIIDAFGGPRKTKFDVIGWLLPVIYKEFVARKDSGAKSLLDELLSYLLSCVDETAKRAHFATTYDAGAYVLLHSDFRTDAVLLDALISIRDYKHASEKLIPKLISGLFDCRKNGRWTNTQENCFVLVALDHYFNAYEATVPDFTVRSWLRNVVCTENKFKGRSTDTQMTRIPMDFFLKQKGLQNLAISKEGPGRLYCRIGVNYCPQDFQMGALDRGFVVEKKYELVGKVGAEVFKFDEKNHRLTMKAGSFVKTTVKVFTKGVRYHAAVVDNLPAGLEAQNPSLPTFNVDDAQGKEEQDPFRWWSNWYEHINYRDSRVEAFATILWPGEYELTYVAKATCAGSFIVPPAKSEEMYEPETFGRCPTFYVDIV